MAKIMDKEALFQDYFQTASEVFNTFESVFNVDGVWSKVFGVDDGEKYSFSSEKTKQAAIDHVRASGAWQTVSALYDYAVNGVLGDHDSSDVVISGAEVLRFLDTENCSPSDEWEQIIWQGDGRHSLDAGQPVMLEKLAFLASVDVRTVRNAISGGELIAYKSDDGSYIENASARSWLNGRRGFKPTVIVGESICGLNDVSGPGEFGAFLSAQRKRIGLEGDESKLVVFHPSVDSKALQDVERGMFRLPIDTVFPIADFYQLDRKEFLACVMRVFYGEELSVLAEAVKAE